jgi:LysR family hca operon transcriptional activator
MFIGMSKTAPTLQAIIDDYLNRAGLTCRAEHQIDNLGMAMSLVASTRGVTLLPAYAQNFLTWSVVSRPLKGETPMINLVIGYHRANTSPILKLFLSKSDDLISRVSKKMRTAARASA